MQVLLQQRKWNPSACQSAWIDFYSPRSCKGQVAAPAGAFTPLPAAGSPRLCWINPFIKAPQEGAEPQPSSNPPHSESCSPSTAATSPGAGVPPATRGLHSSFCHRHLGEVATVRALMCQPCCFFEDVALPAEVLQQITAYRYVKRSSQQPASVRLESVELAETVFSVFVSVARTAPGTKQYCLWHPVCSNSHFPPLPVAREKR